LPRVRKLKLNPEEIKLDRLFETRSHAWERVGLARQVSAERVRRARREMVVLVPLIVGVFVAFSNRRQFFGHGVDTAVRTGTVILLAALGWTLARDVGQAAAPAFYRRMDPGTAGTVGFLIRLVTIAATVLAALWVAGLNVRTLAVGGAFTAVVLGLAAQQTLGNLIAGMVLLSARPFRVGERVRLQAGVIAGQLEGVVSSLGLLYTTLARGEDRIMVPNSSVLTAAVVPLREPEPVNVRVRLESGLRVSRLQAILDEGISTPTRAAAEVILEEVDGDDVIVRVRATPERSRDGAQLADEMIAVVRTVTGEHELVESSP
jgi:small-conductance mechanosensitive channel